MGVRPSELWRIYSPLAAFYFDRAIRNWARFVDQKSEEAELNVRMQMKNRKGTDGFAMQAREVAFSRLLGLSEEALYAAPSTTKAEKGQKRDLGRVRAPKALDAEGRSRNVSRFR